MVKIHYLIAIFALLFLGCSQKINDEGLKRVFVPEFETMVFKSKDFRRNLSKKDERYILNFGEHMISLSSKDNFTTAILIDENAKRYDLNRVFSSEGILLRGAKIEFYIMQNDGYFLKNGIKTAYERIK
ncbi:hypothetical protein [Campylobacter hyointestinalis]|uniref:hypothetical protein n=1 Tax=Campylobacter hyointestinalis TaxID=198 RepID=UPI000DCBAAE2|nr:hypothetical protein [Campylobacter hyointestinalis]RAZ22450.1 hypothetical protein CHL9752_09005 [Campylobacter hyointestinalis subsp. lawsonii]RAZ38270.1 hypothetical protein CHL9426_06555 [Campylobacter hyointestinalis subsp. lawsonii]RAZ54852.1 hypothetical protein CHL10074_06140 [Campylobacter hyointestinalis subsp. lawsonii]RAZ63522.1 hypothetical protein CHL9767_06530 [Campylobacter hyointestinalis subsp. lawsonii]